MTDRAARAVERRAEPSSARFDLGEILEAEPELLELPRRDAGQRIAGLRGRLADADVDSTTPTSQTTRHAARQHAVRFIGGASAAASTMMRAAHEVVAGAAHLRAFEGVAARRVGA